MATFTDQSFRELCDVVREVYTNPEHVEAVGWDADTPEHHIEGAVIAEIHARMEEFVGERMEVAERVRAQRIHPETLGESHTRRRREEIISFLSNRRGEGLSHPDTIINETVRAVVENWRRALGARRA